MVFCYPSEFIIKGIIYAVQKLPSIIINEHEMCGELCMVQTLLFNVITSCCALHKTGYNHFHAMFRVLFNQKFIYYWSFISSQHCRLLVLRCIIICPMINSFFSVTM